MLIYWNGVEFLSIVWALYLLEWRGVPLHLFELYILRADCYIFTEMEESSHPLFELYILRADDHIFIEMERSSSPFVLALYSAR